MLEVKFSDGQTGVIKDSTFHWIGNIGRSTFNPDYWKWADSLKRCKKLTVEMNRFTWHIYCADQCGEVLQQKNEKEVFCAVTPAEFNEIEKCKGKTHADMDIH